MTDTTDTDVPAIKAYASGLNLDVMGVISLTVDAVPARRPNSRISFKTIDPNIDEPTQIPQVYWNEDTGMHYMQGEMDKAREVDGVLHRVTPDEIDALKEAVLPTGEATIAPFAADEIDAVTRPGGSAYWLRPSTPTTGRGKSKTKKAVPASQLRNYALLVDALAADPTKAWVMEMTLRGEQKMWRLVSWQDRLLLSEVIRPGEFSTIPAVETTYDGRLLDGVLAAAEANMQPFKPDEYVNFYRDRAAAMDEAKRTGAPVPAAAPLKVVVDDTGDDNGLLALLEASVKQAKPKRKSA